MRTKQFAAAMSAPIPGIAALVAAYDMQQQQIDQLRHTVSSQQQQIKALLEIISQLSRSGAQEAHQVEEWSPPVQPSPLMKIKTNNNQ